MGYQCSSRGMKRITRRVIPVFLILNILSGITMICLIAKMGMFTSLTRGNKIEGFKRMLDKEYQENYSDLHVQLGSKKTFKQERAAPSLEFLSLLKPVVHLSVLNFDRTLIGREDRSSPIRNWALTEGSERTLMYNGMRYENGRVIVPATGVYYIYSHVKFYVEDNKRDETQKIFYHGIVRYNALTGTEESLISNQVTECKEGINEGAHLEYPSDIRGVVRLNAGDSLTVNVSDSVPLRHDRDWHYFGAYLV